jgi:hypothetical protein
MSERLDQIEALLLTTVERLNESSGILIRTNETLARAGTRQDRIAEEIDILLGAVSSNEVACRELRIQTEQNAQRFEILRAEAIADRKKMDVYIEAVREFQRSSEERFRASQAEIAADRQRIQERFEAMQARMDANRQ